jgi:hypothetical protein
MEHGTDDSAMHSFDLHDIGESMSAVPALSKPTPASHRCALDSASARALAKRLAPFAQGRSIEEIAEGLETSLSLDEAVALGELSEAEQRELEGRASRADLEELGYTILEIEGILARQRART